MLKLKLLDFNTKDNEFLLDDDDPELERRKDILNEMQESSNYNDSNIRKCFKFCINIFGIDEERNTYSVLVNNFKPYFYCRCPNTWKEVDKKRFVNWLNLKKGIHINIIDSKLIKSKKLYGFDNNTLYNFIQLYFNSEYEYRSFKYLWYNDRNLIPGGLKYKKNVQLELYEAQIPPLLRFFHENNISPSGWISICNGKYKSIKTREKLTNCNYEVEASYKDIEAMMIDNLAPYKICSFDIEASSSHGDFPLPQKTYKKLACEIIEVCDKKLITKELFSEFLHIAIGNKENNHSEISKVYTKRKIIDEKLTEQINMILEANIRDIKLEVKNTIENIFQSNNLSDDEDEYSSYKRNINYCKNDTTNILDFINNKEISRDVKIDKLNSLLISNLPEVEGDIVTFIGSTFINYGSKDIYKNHCLVLNDCDEINNINNVEIEECKTEKELLIKWRNLILEEDPDIIIGYNIFGFDYEFLFRRAYENRCVTEFLKLSRVKNEICGKRNKQNNYELHETNIVLASGPHILKYINMTGRLQIDLYNYFRRDYNLESYKLDFVSGNFIGDSIKGYKNNEETNITTIKSDNLSGLTISSYIHIEELGHTNEYLFGGKKFKVLTIDLTDKSFIVEGSIELNLKNKIKWCLAKDDVSPQDIFKLTNGSKSDRAIVAKYCIQDCNLVHSLLKKIDVITGFIEMSKICSVPISYLVLRGQGIKLTSFISKKCREKNTLMPVLKSVGDDYNDEGYEGAIVLEPKCNLYIDNPVACVDYSSLYPSSMISENLCHSSKVWTMEYDLTGKLLEDKTWGERDENGRFIYDNLSDYTYVEVEYDTFAYIRKSAKSAAQKVKTGTKKCRFAEHKDYKAILPSVLEELLSSRKATKKQMAKEDDPFMKNILDKRQLSIKLTANSLYGQCGAKTSTFYEKDVAASTTATGRKLIIYAKNLIEEVYGDTICETKNYGKVRTNAEYIYGDTDSVFFTFNLKDIETNQPIVGKKALEITIELAQEAGELASKFLKNPHDLEYEKTFDPFLLVSKKRYVGMLYETDINKAKCKSMGLVLKRRDNAPIVKDIYGGIIDILMKNRDIEKSVNFLDECLNNILDGNISFDKFIITKSLRSGYKNPAQIAHKVLADRMGQRDIGNKPSAGDRIPFAYILTKKKGLQGDRIEHPGYIKEKKIKLDYGHYITNQIMKPILQIYSLILFEIPALKRKSLLVNRIKRELVALKNMDCDIKKKEEQIKNKYVQQLLFDKYIEKCEHIKCNTNSITKFFK